MNGVHCQISSEIPFVRELGRPVSTLRPHQREYPVQNDVGGIENRGLPDQRPARGDQETGAQQRRTNPGPGTPDSKSKREQTAVNARDEHDDAIRTTVCKANPDQTGCPCHTAM